MNNNNNLQIDSPRVSITGNSNISHSETINTSSINLLIEKRQQNELLVDMTRKIAIITEENKKYQQRIDILNSIIDTLKSNETKIILMNEDIKRLNQQIRTIIQNIQHANQTHITTQNNIINQKLDRNLSDYLCQICLDMPRDCLLEPCMHFCLCQSCYHKLSDNKCPICRRNIEYYQNVFIS